MQWTVVPRKGIDSLPLYEPGRPMEDVARELGLDTIDDMVKLASNENALGPSPKAIEAMQTAAARMHLYPDGGSHYLRCALAERLQLDASHILPGNGSNELIELLGHVFLNPGDEIVMSECAFVIYKIVATAMQARTVAVPMTGFTHDLDAMCNAITPRTKLVFIANPNNPTGTVVTQAEIDAFMARVPDHVLVVFDEAYVELLPKSEQPDTLNYVREGRPVCILRTFSKAYGLAGLRLGYAVGHPDLIPLLNRVRQPFNVNAMVQAAALAALDDEDHVEKTRRMVQDGLKQLGQGLDAMGVPYEPSRVNMLLVRVGEGRAVFKALQERHVIVRPMDGYRLPEYVRVTVGTREENDRLLKALSEVLKQEATDVLG